MRIKHRLEGRAFNCLTRPLRKLRWRVFYTNKISIITNMKKVKQAAILQTEEQIQLVKTQFASTLKRNLQLVSVSSPLIVRSGTGINDDLNGIESPVAFPIADIPTTHAEVVHSLAKWKRQRLHEFGFEIGTGLLTDMRALRTEETLSHLHSVYVDQWDWERVINSDERHLLTLRKIVSLIYQAILTVESEISTHFPDIPRTLPTNIHFVHAEELQERWPALTPKEREHNITKEFKAVFIIGIGGELGDGTIHDGRAADYDDWSTRTFEEKKGLNGDLLLWHSVLEEAIEVSSMGIRVDSSALKKQLEIRDCSERARFDFHKAVLQDVFPQTIGGGIGQSRLCMVLLKKRHIGEVQVSVWPDAWQEELEKKGVKLL